MSGLAPLSGVPQLGKYELLEEIGHGGMATVYRARDRRLGREVAVKVIHKHLRENAEVGARFVAEARAAAKLRHPGIVEVFDVSSEGETERYIVAELLRGCTLRKLLQQNRQMPAEIGASIVLLLCEALEHAHEAAIIHRDIKPENVLVELPCDRSLPSVRIPKATDSGSGVRQSDPQASSIQSGSFEDSGAIRVAGSSPSLEAHRRASDGARRSQPEREGSRRMRVAEPAVVIKLTDFGIAKILDAQGVTSTGQVLGSPAHMAPEQIEGGEVDARTDVFGLGVLMYECVVGHLPFEGKNPAQVLRRVLEGVCSPADRERPIVGGRWARIVAQALARDPAARTATPAALGEQIQSELDALGIPDPRAEITSYFADPARYSEAHALRITPLLLTRAEKARREGDVPGAAADFNRALAFCPNDQSILKRIGSLNSAAQRRQLMQRIGAILAVSAALGCAAFGVARLMKKGTRAVEESPPVLIAALPSPRPSLPAAPSAPLIVAERPAPAAAPPSALPMQRPKGSPLVFVPPSPLPPPTAPSGTRSVKFLVNPLGAKLLLDGQPVNWFSGTVTLAPGGHQITAFMDGSKCCKTLETTLMVHPAPADNQEQVQSVPLALEILPASVTLLAGAPPNGQYVCSSINLSGFPGSTLKVKLNEPIWSGKCQFTTSNDKPARSSTVVLRAGELNVISWPAD